MGQPNEKFLNTPLNQSTLVFQFLLLNFNQHCNNKIIFTDII